MSDVTEGGRRFMAYKIVPLTLDAYKNLAYGARRQERNRVFDARRL